MWKIGWGISNLCNMHCDFCYSKKARQIYSSSSIQSVMEFLAQNASEIDSINFGTGEPTLVPSFFEICEQLKSFNPNLKIGVTTNGTLAEKLIDKDNLEVFKHHIDDVDISLDYYISSKHDISRGYDGAFQKAINTLEICNKYGKNTSIVCALQSDNCYIENIDGLMRLARIYNSTFRINIYRPTNTFDFVVDYNRLKRIIMHIVNTYSVISISDPLFSWLLQTEKPKTDPTGKTSFRILPNGRISPSTYLLDNEWVGLLADKSCSIQRLVNSVPFQRINQFQIPPVCLNCDGRDQCGSGALDRRWLWYKNYQEQDPYCPKRFGDTIWRSKEEHINVVDSDTSFVHDGYLPTLFFSPKVSSNEHVWDNIYKNAPSYLSSDKVASFVSETCSDLNCSENTFVLDLGSGLGRNGRWFLDKGANVTFCDTSFIANDILQKNLLLFPNRYRILQQDYIAFLNESTEKWDVILMLHLLSHGTITEIESVISKAVSKLNKNGLVLFTLASTKDYRFTNQNPESKKCFALCEGPEAGIMHSFFDFDDIKSIIKNEKLIYINEIVEKHHAHWEIVLKKSN